MSTLVQHVSVYDGSTSDATFSSAVTGGNLIVAVISGDASTTPAPTIADTDSNSWTTLSCYYHNFGGDQVFINIAYVYNAKHTGNTDKITWTPGSTGSPADVGVQILEFSGIVSASDPLDVAKVDTVASGSTTTPTSGNIVTSNTDLIFVCYANEAEVAGGVTAGTGYAISDSNSETHSDFQEYATGVAAGTLAPYATTGSGVSQWILSVVAFKETGGPPPPTANGNFLAFMS